MNNTFLNKVAAERRVLSVINAHFHGSDQLTGLSRPAVDLWQRTVGARASNDVVTNLIGLAELCQCLSDRSHESFLPLNKQVEKGLEDGLLELMTTVRHEQHGG